jgi:hypothetical protein
LTGLMIRITSEVSSASPIEIDCLIDIPRSAAKSRLASRSQPLIVAAGYTRGTVLDRVRRMLVGDHADELRVIATGHSFGIMPITSLPGPLDPGWPGTPPERLERSRYRAIFAA